MKKIIKKILKEQSELPTMDIYHISMGEDWDKGYDHKSDLFFKDYDKAVEYLTSNEYEKSDYPSINSNVERWSKGYGYHGDINPTKTYCLKQNPFLGNTSNSKIFPGNF